MHGMEIAGPEAESPQRGSRMKMKKGERFSAKKDRQAS
jgi:hypothetical protein